MTTIIWNRHLATCTGFSRTGTRCSKCIGSRAIAQRNLYAANVNAEIMGLARGSYVLACPLATLNGSPVVFDVRTGDVDRPRTGDYMPGNVCYVSRDANATRSRFQSEGSDIPGAAEYAAEVLRVSLSLTVPTEGEAVVWWRNRPTGSPVVYGWNR